MGAYRYSGIPPNVATFMWEFMQHWILLGSCDLLGNRRS